MGKKKGGRGAERWQNKDTKSPKIRTRAFNEEDMDDEIDTFHKQRDIVPLDVDEDIDTSDEDDVQGVLDIEGQEDDDDDDDHDDKFTEKIKKQQKILRRKTGGVEDETHDDFEEDEVKTTRSLGYGACNVDYELESGDEDLAEEEAEVIRTRKRNAELQSIEDFVAEDIDLEESASDGEKTIEHILHNKSKVRSRPQDNNKGAEDDTDAIYEVKKDLKALSRKEQMEVVYSSAPELVGLLSELKDALHELDSKVNPLISKLKERNGGSKEGMRYLETKHLLLLAYCQAISFYLLLKSEGHPVRDHPVIARLVEIKNLLDKMKELDEKLPSELEEILNQDHDTKSEVKLSEKALTLISEPIGRDNKHSSVSITKSQVALPCETTELISCGFLQENGNKQENKKKQIGLQSMEMLKVRASLEEKLKQKGVFKSRKIPSQPANLNSRLESIDDFGDAIIDKEEGNASSMRPSKLTKLKKLKVVSGDDDLPKRDDIGERRRKHELRVLANAGVKYDDEVGDEPEASEDEPEASEDELIKQAKRRKLVKLSEKAELYSRTQVAPSLAEPEIVDGKRQITRQIYKNRGLTRSRNTLHKNPRRNYRRKHEEKVKSRQGAVRSIRKPTGPSYDGEHTGINPGISRSTRFNNESISGRT